jgi:uncharacterized membrane protein
MFIGWNIPAKKWLKKGLKPLRIYFHSAVNVGMERLRKVPYTLMAANEIAPENERSNVFTRKAPFHYGWDTHFDVLKITSIRYVVCYKIWKIKVTKSEKITDCLLLCITNIIFALHNNCSK